MKGTKEIESLLLKQKKKVVTIDVENKTVDYSKKLKLHQKIKAIRGDYFSEEIVRAYLINRLVNELGYIEQNIEIEKEYTQSSIGRDKKFKNTGRIDILVKDKHGNPFLFIEVKAPHKFEEDKKEIKGQLFNLSDEEEKKFNTKVHYLVYYSIDIIDDKIQDNVIIIDKNKTKTYDDWENNGFVPDANEIPYNYDKAKKELYIKPKGKNKEKYKELKVIDKFTLSTIRTDIHNRLWSSGIEDNEAYLFLVKYLLTKIFDEGRTKPGEEYQCQIFDTDYEDENSFLKRINERYIDALRDKLNYDESKLKNAGQIISTEKIPISSLYFLVEKLEKFSFTKSLRKSKDDILGAFFEDTNREKYRQSKGAFFTTTNVVKFIIYALKLDELALERFIDELELPYIIDPSTGSGTFLIEAMKIITKTFREKRKKLNLADDELDKYNDFFKATKPNKWAEKYIYGIDNSYSLAISTKVNMILHGDGSSNIFQNDGLANLQTYYNLKGSKLAEISRSENYYTKPNANILVNERFDMIISNPPFSVKLTEKKENINKYFIFGDKKNSENLFIERWYQLLKPGGRLGVVLPESVFDTTENKYIRLFLFKYFNIKAVVSLPQITFEPYTSTKTSLLFAQKKTKKQVEKWNELWIKYGNEWSLLRTRINDYIQYFVKGKKLNKKWAKDVVKDIENNNKENILKNIYRFIKDYIAEGDKKLDIKELLEKYSDEITILSKYEKETDVFGFYNAWWVFGEVAKELDYDIFMAEAENVGYKRTKRGENKMPNDLYDIEHAPQTLDTDKIIKDYEKRIKNKTERKKELEKEKTTLEKKIAEKKNTTAQNKLDKTVAEIESVKNQIEQLKSELEQVKEIFETYYENDELKEEYYDRTDKDLINHFEKGLLKQYKSEDILLRKNEVIKILDAIRKEVIWK